MDTQRPKDEAPPDWIRRTPSPEASSYVPREPLGQSTELFLLGATTQPEAENYVRNRCGSEVVSRLPELVSLWQKAAETFGRLSTEDPAAAEGGETKEIDQSNEGMLNQFASDPLFQASFSGLPYEFKLVPIDNLIAGQRTVNLNYIESLTQRLGSDLSGLMHVCLAPRNGGQAPERVQYAPTGVIYTSANKDLRFIGGYVKEIDQSDLDVCRDGGIPAAALVLVVGYGIQSLNVIGCGRRLILANGFHRAYAARAAGATHVPAVVRRVANPGLELPPVLVGLPKDYLLSHPRPALMKDFFDERLVVRLPVTATQRTIKVNWGFEQYDIPLAGESSVLTKGAFAAETGK